MSDKIIDGLHVGMTGFSDVQEMIGELKEKKVLITTSEENLVAVCFFAVVLCRLCEYTPANLPKAIADYLDAKKIINPGNYDIALGYITDCVKAANRIIDGSLFSDYAVAYLPKYTMSRVFYDINENLRGSDRCWIQKINGFIYSHITVSELERIKLGDIPFANAAVAIFDAVLDYQLVDHQAYMKAQMLNIHGYAKLSDTHPPTPQARTDFLRSLSGQGDDRGVVDIYDTAKSLVFLRRKNNMIGGSVFNKLCHIFDVCIPG